MKKLFMIILSFIMIINVVSVKAQSDMVTREYKKYKFNIV